MEPEVKEPINIREGYRLIPGWGIDADPDNEPTYPIKDYNGDDHLRINWERPEQQPVDVEILKSNEHGRMPAVFGNTLPPSGLSGAIRRFAFKYSENSFAHWLPLIVADRINMVEGLIDDVRNGYFPNLPAERGWNAEWKYNRAGAVKKIAVAALVTGAVVGLIYMKSKQKRK